MKHYSRACRNTLSASTSTELVDSFLVQYVGLRNISLDRSLFPSEPQFPAWRKQKLKECGRW